MKQELAGLEIYYITKELQGIIGSKIDRVYHSKNAKKEFLFAVHTPNFGKQFLTIQFPSIIYLAPSKKSYDDPTGFCMYLRKNFEGTRIQGVRQHAFERVIELKIEQKYMQETQSICNTYFIILELFGKGNMIVCNEQYKILQVLEIQHWANRPIKKDETYVFPNAGINILNCSAEELKNIIAKSNKDSIVKTLAIECSLGGVYAEELCTRAGIDKKTTIIQLTAEHYTALYQALQCMLNETIKTNTSGNQLFPITMQLFPAENTYETFSQGITAFADTVAVKQAPHTMQTEKYQRIIEQQEKTLHDIEEEIIENQHKGELIYEHYQTLNTTLQEIKQLRTKHAIKDLKEKLKNHTLATSPLIMIKDIDEKNKTIIVEIE